MKLKDARYLSAEGQEALRYRVVNAVENGMSKSEAARVFQVSRTAVHNWTKAVANGNASSLKAKSVVLVVLAHVCSPTKQQQQ
ncbi:MAG: hypothetical protein CLLPBCKN_001311 [Chroococcidiopsis cubana SAG 39.79]|uniref:helix-turn-helix domain-containing protein n=1 Tax=Chroococcidiopsis cubana TaxID=171392 RepID=UPI002AC578D2|nr:helix-turn-helix domain-containing protein [Chroococcidiopsis cubana]MDZ4871923.1 hypothetical protein [Chroococcidiopsis cubana SAG 39.79]